MPTNPRTAARSAKEQAVWDEIFIHRYNFCLSEVNERGLEGCAQWAADQADAAIAERRQRTGQSR